MKCLKDEWYKDYAKNAFKKHIEETLKREKKENSGPPPVAVV